MSISGLEFEGFSSIPNYFLKLKLGFDFDCLSKPKLGSDFDYFQVGTFENSDNQIPVCIPTNVIIIMLYNILYFFKDILNHENKFNDEGHIW